MVWIIRKGWFLSNLSGEIPVMYQILLRIISWFQIKFSYFLHKSTFYTSSSLHHLVHSLDLLKWKINLKFHTFWPIPPQDISNLFMFLETISFAVLPVRKLVWLWNWYHLVTFFIRILFLHLPSSFMVSTLSSN